MKLFILGLLINFMTLEAYALDSLSYSGRLVNPDGSPVSGPVDIRFILSYTNTPATARCTKILTNVPLSKGVFHVKLNYTSADCLTLPLTTVLSNVPAGESVAIQVSDLTHAKDYTYQALHSIPSSIMANMAKTLHRMGANPDEFLKWDGTKWVPAAIVGATGGTVTEIIAGTGLDGGTITTTGTISIASSGVDTLQIADGAVTNAKIANGIARTKLVNGTANYVLVNSGTGVISETANLTIAQGGTGATTASGAWTNLGLGTSAGFNYASCLAGEVSKFVLPGGWTCISDVSSDNTKLPLAGGTMTGSINMNSLFFVINLANPVDPGDATNKAYVDAQIGGVSQSQWTTAGTNIHYNAGNVGIGTATPSSPLHVASSNGSYGAYIQHGLAINHTSNFILTAMPFGPNAGVEIRDLSNVYGDRGIRAGFGLFDGTQAGATRLTVKGATAQTADLVSVQNVGGTALVRIDASGNVHASGDSSVHGKLRLKSDNTNFVELKSPAALAASITLNLPNSVGTTGQALITDGSGNLSWSTVATGATSVGGDLSGTMSNATIINNAVTSAKIADGAIVDADVAAAANIAQSKIAGLDTSLSGKENTVAAGLPGQFYHGDKTWQTVSTSVVTEGSNLYFTKPRVLGTDLAGFGTSSGSITAADTVLSALGKLAGNQGLFVMKTGDSMVGSLAMGNNLISGVATPTASDHAVNKAYVDTAVSGNSHWSKVGTTINYAGGNVGIGSTSPTTPLHVIAPTIATPVATFEGITGQTANLTDWKVAGATKASISNEGHFVNSGGDVKIQTSGGANTVFRGVRATSAWSDLVDSQWFQVGNNSDNIAFTAQNGTNANRMKFVTNSFQITNGNNTNPPVGVFEISDNTTGLFNVLNNGNVGIGTSTPTSKLHLKAGTSTAQSAPLKFSSGTLLTTPEAGAIEFDGTNLYFTDSAANRKPLAGASSPNFTGAITTNDKVVSPTYYGSTAASGNIIIDSTTDASKGDVIIAPSGGDIGIGTSTPAGMLSNSSTNVLDQTGVGLGSMALNWMGVSAGYVAAFENKTAGANYNGVLLRTADTSASSLILNAMSGTTSRMVVRSDGNVGIGTTSPIEKATIANTNAEALGVYRDLDVTSVGAAGTFINLGARTGTAFTPGAQVIGVLNNPATSGTLSFSTRSSNVMNERMRISSEGNVGIGTASPTSSLDIYNGSANPYLKLRNSPSVSYSGIQMQSSGATVLDILAGPGGAYYSSNIHTFRNSAQTTNYMTINASGDVGIGTTSPSAGLDVKGLADTTGQSSLLLRSGNTSNNFSSNQITFGFANSASYRHAIKTRHNAGTNVNNAIDFYLWTGTDAVGAIGTKQVMTLDGTGNVGVGTTTPVQSLDFGSAMKNLKFNYAHLGETGSGAATLLGNNMRASTTVSNTIEIGSNGVDAAHGLQMLYSDGFRFLSVPQNHGLPVGSAIDINSYTKMRIDSSGNVGIGTATPSTKLDVVGDVRAAGFVATSDIRLKKNLSKSNGFKTLSQINGYRFDWKDSGKSEYGVMAQEVEKVMPEIVVTNPETGIKAVKYNGLFAPIIESIKEIFVEITGHKKKLKEQDRKIASLEQKNKELEERLKRIEASLPKQSAKK